jgi:transposase
MTKKRILKSKPIRDVPIERRAYRSDLTEAQWEAIRPLLPPSAWRGRPRANEREVLNGIFYVLRTGCQWEDLPHDIQASSKTCHRRLLDYQRRRVWQKILNALLQEANRRGYLNFKNAYHDASVIKSKRGASLRSVSRENTGFQALNVTS